LAVISADAITETDYSSKVGFSEVIKIFSGCREVSADSRAAAAQIKIFSFCADFERRNKALSHLHLAQNWKRGEVSPLKSAAICLEVVVL
jgi:hypothetical protein